MNPRSIGYNPNGTEAFFLFAGAGVALTAANLAAIRDANIEEDLRYSADYGFAPASFSVVQSLADVPSNGVPCGFFNGLSVADALAFHTRTAGWPSISIDASGALKDTQVGFSHEHKELRFDPLCTSYTVRIDANGKMTLDADETC